MQTTPVSRSVAPKDDKVDVTDVATLQMVDSSSLVICLSRLRASTGSNSVSLRCSGLSCGLLPAIRV